MKKHTKIYYQYFGYDFQDFIPCEILGIKAVDVHHINSKGMGGNPLGDKDSIENLMAATRLVHDFYGDKVKYKQFLIDHHMDFMANRKPLINVDPYHEFLEDLFIYPEYKQLILWKRYSI